MSWQPPIFNPLSFDSLSKSIANELAHAPVHPLKGLERFEGPGIYALYYTGGFEAYEPLARANLLRCGSWPIYIGKAEASTRKGKNLRAPDDYTGDALYKRLCQHSKTIDAVENLSIDDFQIRALVLGYVWIPMAEASALAMYRPLWNTIIDGFGNHDPGVGRNNQMASRWDTIHPGRAWAARLRPNAFTAEQIANESLIWLSGLALGGESDSGITEVE